ncbi:MAG: cytochrome c3 family protein [Aeromonas sp.]
MKRLSHWFALVMLLIASGTPAFAIGTVAAKAVNAIAPAPDEAQELAKRLKKLQAEQKSAKKFAKCDKCHDEGSELMQGKHSQVHNPNNGDAIACSNCHGQPSAAHRKQRKKPVDVMRFGASPYSASAQNSLCFSCHAPKALQSAFWAHDVHVLKTSCSNCHNLHSSEAAGVKRTDKQRAALCVECHSQLPEHKAKAASTGT